MSGPKRPQVRLDLIAGRGYGERQTAREAQEKALAERVLASADPIVVAVREHHAERDGQCAGCWEDCVYCHGFHEWPCATILVLGEAIS